MCNKPPTWYVAFYGKQKTCPKVANSFIIIWRMSCHSSCVLNLKTGISILYPYLSQKIKHEKLKYLFPANITFGGGWPTWMKDLGWKFQLAGRMTFAIQTQKKISLCIILTSQRRNESKKLRVQHFNLLVFLHKYSSCKFWK